MSKKQKDDYDLIFQLEDDNEEFQILVELEDDKKPKKNKKKKVDEIDTGIEYIKN